MKDKTPNPLQTFGSNINKEKSLPYLPIHHTPTPQNLSCHKPPNAIRESKFSKPIKVHTDNKALHHIADYQQKSAKPLKSNPLTQKKKTVKLTNYSPSPHNHTTPYNPRKLSHHSPPLCHPLHSCSCCSYPNTIPSQQTGPPPSHPQHSACGFRCEFRKRSGLLSFLLRRRKSLRL